jgi:hypothetical protein
MAKIEPAKQGRILQTKCAIDNQEPATQQIHFTYGWLLPVCDEHLKEILRLKEKTP